MSKNRKSYDFDSYDDEFSFQNEKFEEMKTRRQERDKRNSQWKTLTQKEEDPREKR
jgi:hypothetical protein